ncbi:hypothetical protein BDZ91DRAFT_538947 [Kalaharituber pfeilii]|nr:hypothetical protein BDZ91DRAFT_538947 [Kalaharituber pfeilii]
MALIGISVGIGWAILGTYLGSLCYETNPSATMAIKAVFLVVAMFVHGYIRSCTPRLFIMVLLMAVPVLLALTSATFYVTKAFVVMFFYPMLTAVGILLVVNVFLFPEFGATGLGLTTVETLQLTISILNDAAELFVESCGEKRIPWAGRHCSLQHQKKVIRLAEVTASKSALRAKVNECKNTYRDCAFDISYSCLAPKELKPIAGKGLGRLVMNVMALVGACESKYALMGTTEFREHEDTELENGEEETPNGRRDANRTMNGTASGKKQQVKEKEKDKEKEKGKDAYLPELKVKRAIEGGDQRLLKHLLTMVALPVNTLQQNIDRSIDVINTCVACVYEVPRLPSLKQGKGKVRHPGGILLQELDIHIDSLSKAIAGFAEKSTSALEGAAVFQEIAETEVDVMPRDEIFLISSFMLNLRLAAAQTLDMLRHARSLVEAGQERKGKRTFHWPDVSFRRWVSSGTEETEAMSASNLLQLQEEEEEDDYDDPARWGNPLVGDVDARGWGTASKTRENENRAMPESRRRTTRRPEKQNKPWWIRMREVIADFLDWVRYNDNILYAFKFTCGIMLITWPAFLHNWTHWYDNARGVWVAVVFVLIFENAVGATVWIFFLRAVGTIAGSTLGYGAYESGHGNPILMGIIIILGTIPAFYFQLGTRYMKAAMVFTVSMCVVSISTLMQTVPGTSFENFYKRASASLIGGGVALLVQVILIPVKARSKLKDHIATAIAQINNMESCVALGVDEKQTHMLKHPRFLRRFERAAKKAGSALGAAEGYLEYTKHEPRIKGCFEPHREVYRDILFVLRQIVDRMENLLRLRIAYGSAVLEEFNARMHSYRRNVAAAITLTLYAVSQSLTLKLPLPQFLPSARLAHLRMVVRVRQILHEESIAAVHSSYPPTPRTGGGGAISIDENDKDMDEVDKAVEKLAQQTNMNSGYRSAETGNSSGYPGRMDSQSSSGSRGSGNDSGNDSGGGNDSGSRSKSGHRSGTATQPHHNFTSRIQIEPGNHPQYQPHNHGLLNHHVSSTPSNVASSAQSMQPTPAAIARRKALRLKILSWNASSAALEECVEYVEELVDLVKVLVGVNEFRSGLLHRPTFREYLRDVCAIPEAAGDAGGQEQIVDAQGTRDRDGNVAGTASVIATENGDGDGKMVRKVDGAVGVGWDWVTGGKGAG